MAELNNEPRRDAGPELRNVPDLEPMPAGEVQGLAVGAGGETAVAELNNGSRKDVTNISLGTCSGPPDSESGEGGKQRKQDLVTVDYEKNAKGRNVSAKITELQKCGMETKTGMKRTVLVAGRGASAKKRKEGEMKIGRIEDLIARMGGEKRKKNQEGEVLKRQKNVLPGL